jgi:acyl-CoA thioesterase FadM
MGSKSFDMSCSIVRVVDGVEVEAAKGLAIVVCFNYKENVSIAIPEKWKTKMLG